MSNDDIIRIAREAGLAHSKPRTGDYDGGRVAGSITDLIRFAALVAAAEREACAKLFDGEVWAYDYREIAAEIRARGEQ
jgi:hypothetical protein